MKKVMIIGIRVLKAYDGSLIAGTVNAHTGCEMWRYTT